jgi:hypothetical protein
VIGCNVVEYIYVYNKLVVVLYLGIHLLVCRQPTYNFVCRVYNNVDISGKSSLEMVYYTVFIFGVPITGE